MIKQNLTIQRLALAVSALLIPGTTALGVITYSSGYFGSVLHTHQGGGAIVGFDQGPDGNFYYQTESGDYTFGGFYSWDGSSQTTIAPENSSYFTGRGVVSIGDYVYYNVDGLTFQDIYRFGPVSGTNPGVILSGTGASYSLHTYGGDLFITGSINFGTNRIFHATVGADGAVNPPTDLGITSGMSGPLAFDSNGNLYYAPGFNDLSIYRWSAAQVAAAIADPTANPLPMDSVLWADYSAPYGDVGGVTGMTFDSDGNLAVTLTDYDGPSYLVSFGIHENGSWTGDYTQLLASTERLGDLRNFDGTLHLAAGDTILQIIPEPGTWSLFFGFAATGAVFIHRKHRPKSS